MHPSSAPELEQLLAETPTLLAFARARLRDHHEAEEVVQDCLLAAWNQRTEFAGQSTLRTWLIGILRHKILDRLRARRRRPDHASTAATLDEEEGTDPMPSWFNRHGAWRFDPNHSMESLLANPLSETLRSELRRILRLCADGLPSSLRRLFSLREFDHLDTAEAADLCSVARTSAPVLLSRARLLMRDCLQRRLSR